MSDRIEQAYSLASQQYADFGVDVEDALRKLATIPISLHCWQGDHAQLIVGIGIKVVYWAENAQVDVKRDRYP